MANLKQFKKAGTLELLEEGVVVSEARPYLGMSGLGHSCDRYLWLTFRWAYDDFPSRRLNRLFQRGHREEKHIIADLSRIGIRCSALQSKMVAGAGHMRGHNDGMAINVPEAPKTRHLLEFKTMSNASFRDTVKKGMQASKPIYYGQVQLYMRKLKVTRCLWIAVNKDNDAYYIERVKLDKGYADDLERKGESIILADSIPPIRSPHSVTFYECKWCEAKPICYSKKKFKKNCRTCIHSGPANEGKWVCEKFEKEIPLDFQRIGCDEYQALETK